jgi:pimeloyl-ACP methyl ester carboxylesterase
MSLRRSLVTTIVRELPAVVRMGSQVIARPAQPLFTGRGCEAGDATLAPVLLLHGFAGVAAHVAPWQRHLTEHQCYTLGYRSTGDPIATALNVAGLVEQLSERHGAPVDVVGHSLGGLLALSARSLLQHRARTEVLGTCVTVCSPLQGANLPSAPLRKLRELAVQADLELVLNIAAEHDHVVSAEDAVLPGADWALVRNAGHLSVVTHERTLKLITSACAQASAAHRDEHARDAALPLD